MPGSIPSAGAVAANALLATGIVGAVDPLTFTAPLLATVLLSQLPPAVVARTHRRAADVLHEDGVPIGAVCNHLLASLPERDPWVVHALCSAADEAIEAGEQRRAVEFLRRAAVEPPEPCDRVRVTSALAFAEADGDVPEAIERLQAALKLIADHVQQAEALRVPRACISRAPISRT